MSVHARQGLLAGFLLLVAAGFLFGWDIGFPKTPAFDEFHYVPAAKEFLSLASNRNYEHPPLGKYFVAAGIALFGDTPLGWRAFSWIFGLVTLGASYSLAWALLGSWPAALFGALLVLFNGTLFVQSRIAMLDTYMTAFVFVSSACFAWFWRRRGRPGALPLLYGGGAALGAAAACKWFGLVPWAFAGLFAFAYSLRRPGLLPLKHALLALGLAPAVVYVASFLPLLLLPTYSGLSDLLRLHEQMWGGQRQVGGATHTYASPWYEWPFMIRPIWYVWEMEKQIVRGQIFLGNPFLMWGGLVALGALAWRWWRDRRWTDAALVGAWALFSLSWALLPRKLGFYYYYYPSSIWISLAVAAALPFGRKAWVWGVLVAAAAFFIFAYPVLSGMPLSYKEAMMRIWFHRWI